MLRLILCAVIVAGRPERYRPRHRSDGYEPVADDNGEDIGDLFDVSPMQPCGRRITECIDDVCRSDDRCAWPPASYDPPERQAIQTAYVHGVYLPLTGAVALDDTVTDWPPRISARREARAALWRPPGPGWAHQAAAALADEYWPKAIEAAS